MMRVYHWSQNDIYYPKNQKNSLILRIFAFKSQQKIGIRKMKHEILSLENVQIIGMAKEIVFCKGHEESHSSGIC